jgi:hypothetical protein
VGLVALCSANAPAIFSASADEFACEMFDITATTIPRSKFSERSAVAAARDLTLPLRQG